MSTPAVRCSGVVKTFRGVRALDGLDLTVPTGQIVGYLGPNGAGKSTTLRILLDLARQDAGTVEVLGESLRTAGASLRRRIGYLPGELRLDDRFTVRDTLDCWRRLRPGRVEPGHLDALCKRFELNLEHPVRGLSTGTRRKVGLVGAFMHRPELLLLDEPTAGLDPLMQAEFRALVRESCDDGATVFLSSHLLNDVQRLAEAVIVIRAGRVIANKSVRDLRLAARQPFTVWFAAAPPLEQLAAVTNVGELESVGNEVNGIVEGDVRSLLEVLARHQVEHLVMPEPDLEQAFLGLYEGTDKDAP